MGFVEKLMDTFTVKEDDEMANEEDVVPVSRYELPTTGNNVAGLTANTKMVLFEPRSFEDCEEIAVHLKSKRATVVNLHRLHKEYAQRTIDFLTGVVFALDGTIKKIGHNVILCSPASIGVAGEIAGQEERKTEVID